MTLEGMCTLPAIIKAKVFCRYLGNFMLKIISKPISNLCQSSIGDLEVRDCLKSLLSIIFIDTRKPKSIPIPIPISILLIIQLIYQYNSTRYTIHIP